MTHHERNVRVALALTMTFVFYFGLSPFNFYPVNQIEPLPDERGAAFGGYGIAMTEAATRDRDWSAERGISIELLVEPRAFVEGESTSLLDFYDGIFPSSLTVRQTGSDFELFARWVTAPGWWGRWRLHGPLMLRTGQPRFVSIASGPDIGTRIYLDAELRANDWKNPLIRPGEPFGGRLVVGSRPSGRAGWVGDFRGLAIFDRGLSAAEIEHHYEMVARGGFAALAESADLLGFYTMIPTPDGNGHVFENSAPGQSLGALRATRTFRPPRPRILDVPRSSELGQLWFMGDVLLNVLGFAPLGICLLLLLRQILRDEPGAAIVGAVLLAAALSLLIELGQVLIPSRDSSIVDLGFNILGAILGVAALLIWERQREGSTTAT